MNHKFLHRGDAPFSEKVWKAIDKIVVSSAKGVLTARRLLHTEGPYGLGLKVLSSPERTVEDESRGGGVVLTAATAVSVIEIQSSFTLSARDISAFEETGTPFDVGAVTNAAMECAKMEDELIFNGSKTTGNEGLLNASGVQSSKLKSWEKVGSAADDVISAVNKLDGVGFHGPYTLALAPERYNLLFRRYPQGNQTELNHLKEIVTEGIVKAASLKAGGVLLASGRAFASIVLGQDMTTSFIGPAGKDYEFVISESLALRLTAPSATCVLK
jgi:uncharacterized linocin/CFP29 family protein